MIFKKEILLNKIAEIGDYSTIQYISQSSFFIPLVGLWLLTLITFLMVTFIPEKPKPYAGFIAAIIINLIGTIFILLGSLPSLLTFPSLYLQ